MNKNQVTLEVPLALQQLINANNKLLKNYQVQLMQEIQDANSQMMSILQLNPDAGWKLDLEKMLYVRPADQFTDETESQE